MFSDLRCGDTSLVEALVFKFQAWDFQPLHKWSETILINLIKNKWFFEQTIIKTIIQINYQKKETGEPNIFVINFIIPSIPLVVLRKPKHQTFYNHYILCYVFLVFYHTFP